VPQLSSHRKSSSFLMLLLRSVWMFSSQYDDPLSTYSCLRVLFASKALWSILVSTFTSVRVISDVSCLDTCVLCKLYALL
jgi:hypothetical protein